MSLFRDIVGLSDSSGVAPLLEQAGDTTGGWMIPDYSVLRQNISADNVLDILRLLGSETADIRVVLVLDDVEKWVGTSSIIRLDLARHNTLVGDLARR
jgi:Mg/Co/Ni transporter MgtE